MVCFYRTIYFKGVLVLIFYHVSTSIEHNGHFIPSIPQHRMKGENSTIPRICVAKTIEDCFTGLSVGNSYLRTYIEEETPFFKIFKIDTNKLEIPTDKIINDKEICLNKWVPDVEVTRECWITTDFFVPEEDVTILCIQDFSEKEITYMNGLYKEIVNKQYQGDYFAFIKDTGLKASELIYKSNLIKDIISIGGCVKKGEQIYLYFDENAQMEIQTFIDNYYQNQIHFESDYKNNCYLYFLDNVKNTKPLFYLLAREYERMNNEMRLEFV